MTDNRSEQTVFAFKLRINRYQYGLRGLPVAEINMVLSKEMAVDEDRVVYSIPAGIDSYDYKVWNKLFRSYSEDDLAYFLHEIYAQLESIAKAKNLNDGIGIVFQFSSETL